VRSELVYPAVYGTGPFPRFDGDAVTMVNPCGYKGIAVFLGLADAFPGVAFRAVPTWGATADDLAALRARPNIELAEPHDDIRRILAGARVLVMPSLWDETFGYTAVEALLHGVPVLAADVGGLPEAMLGVPHLLPVTPITRYDAVDGRPVPRIPPQDVAPWTATLHTVLTDGAHRDHLAAAGRRAATGFVAAIDPNALEALLARTAAAV
jgi:glycosyltransferase involved in cell wall biosynthesis